ncbi:MAG: hypothetical protein E7609_07105 [Ruminococcaceae bacterium]|nr:hypothetical protein [Oscillospiraceae bacterium]
MKSVDITIRRKPLLAQPYPPHGRRKKRQGEKYGYYCDGSSSNRDVSHSVMVNCARPLFSQYTVHHAFTNHNHIHDVYFTVTPNMQSYEPSHAPYRDTLFYDLHSVDGDLDALIEAYPVVAEIRDAAGCNIPM